LVASRKSIHTHRSWTLDVLNAIRRLGNRSSGRESAHSNPSSLSRLTPAATGKFTTADVYTFERELEKLHPDKLKNPSADGADARR